MLLSGLKKAIENVFSEHNYLYSEKTQYFLLQLQNISYEEMDTTLKMTNMSVLFEGFYQHRIDAQLKKALFGVRASRWKHHFGIPTVPFLLTYKKQIAQTVRFFEGFSARARVSDDLPWLYIAQGDVLLDPENEVIVDPHSIDRIAKPFHREDKGKFTKTYNPQGGFTTGPCDPISQQFIEHAKASVSRGGKVLEIGAAFGSATLEALATGATVYCNDINPENLAVVRRRFLENSTHLSESASGDDSQLILLPGALPEELQSLPENSFEAILICRVLHFFTGKKIEESLHLLSKLLTPGGKIYVVCETPYQKNWQKFIPEFNNRVARNEEWPGEITNPAAYEQEGRVSSLPKIVHWMTKEIIERCLSRANLTVECAGYINRAGQFPTGILLPQYKKESVGVIGVKR